MARATDYRIANPSVTSKAQHSCAFLRPCRGHVAHPLERDDAAWERVWGQGTLLAPDSPDPMRALLYPVLTRIPAQCKLFQFHRNILLLTTSRPVLPP